MESLPTPVQQEALRKVGLLCVLRDKGTCSEEQIAEKLGFGSADAMHIQLSNWGLPDWLARVDATEAEHHEKSTSKRKRRATRTGEALKLPSAADAVDLFRPVVDRLAQTVDDLSTRKELYRAGRFEQADVYQDPILLSRSAFPDERWQSICEQLGQDPKQETIVLYDVKTANAGGATQFPRETALIAAYVIAGEPIEPLLEALHPNPENADRARLFGRTKPKVEQLKLLAGQVAKLIRGGVVKEGPTTEELSPEEQNVAWQIYSWRRSGLSDKEIRTKLHDQGLTADEINRLGKLNLSPPD